VSSAAGAGAGFDPSIFSEFGDFADVLGSMFVKVQGISTGPAKDELVKNCLADYATEDFEIACYTSLLTAAQEFGDQDLVRTCQRILQDEQDMARWLELQIPLATTEIYRKKLSDYQKAA
jgi:ferritin-like metal-binding protein YciE